MKNPSAVCIILNDLSVRSQRMKPNESRWKNILYSRVRVQQSFKDCGAHCRYQNPDGVLYLLGRASS